MNSREERGSAGKIQILDASSPPADIATAVAKQGAVIVTGLFQYESAIRFKTALERALAEDLEKLGSEYKFRGMVHALMSRGEEFIEWLALPELIPICQALLGDGCIVHAFNSSSMPPQNTNFSRSIHVDCPRLIPGYITNIGVTAALDPFTADNGAMEIIPDSFDEEAAPSEADFDTRKVTLDFLQPGDIVLFNARCWHRGGLNRTPNWRHAITLNVCRSFMRQQFDYPRMLGSSRLTTRPRSTIFRFLCSNAQYHERVPSAARRAPISRRSGVVWEVT